MGREPPGRAGTMSRGGGAVGGDLSAGNDAAAVAAIRRRRRRRYTVVHGMVAVVRRWGDRGSAVVLMSVVGAQQALRLALGRAGLALKRGHAGQSMVEYGIVVALIAIVAFAAMQMLGDSVTAVFTTIMNK